MPRYFFHSVDGGRERDRDGVELPDDVAAQGMAVAFLGEFLKDDPHQLWEQGTLRVEVTNEVGVLLWTLVTLTIDAPRPGPRLAIVQ